MVVRVWDSPNNYLKFRIKGHSEAAISNITHSLRGDNLILPVLHDAPGVAIDEGELVSTPDKFTNGIDSKIEEIRAKHPMAYRYDDWGFVERVISGKRYITPVVFDLSHLQYFISDEIVYKTADEVAKYIAQYTPFLMSFDNFVENFPEAAKYIDRLHY